MYRPNKLFLKNGHSCELSEETDPVPRYIPGTSYCARVRRAFARFRIISELHPYTIKYIKSQARVTMEKENHLENYPYMIHPFSTMHIFWKYIMAPVILASMLTVPMEVSFYFLEHASSNTSWIFTRLILDAVCFIDCIIQILTGHYDEENRIVILDPYKHFWHYFCTGFFPNLFVSIPTYLFVLYLPDWTTLILVTLMLKLSICYYWVRMKKIFHLFGERYGIPYGAEKVPKLIITFFLLLHWFACIQSMFYSLHEESYERFLVYSDRKEVTSALLIITTHYNSSQQILLAGYGDIRLSKINASFYYLYLVCLWLITSALKMLFIVRIKMALVSISETESKYAKMVVHLKAYMHYKKLPQFLQSRVLCYYEFRFQKTYFRESEILKVLCGQLRQDIQVCTCRSLVEKVPFFKNITQSLLARIAQELIHEIYLKNDVILRAGTPANCMYFIITGTVGVYSQKGSEICHLCDGDHFGEIALVVPDKKRIASVVALESCSVYRLDRQDFLKAIIPFPDLQFSIEQIAQERMETTEGINIQSSLNFF